MIPQKSGEVYLFLSLKSELPQIEEQYSLPSVMLYLYLWDNWRCGIKIKCIDNGARGAKLMERCICWNLIAVTESRLKQELAELN